MPRLIDADALDIEGFREDFPLCECDTGWNAAVRMINDYVNAAPTIEAELVKRGKWMLHDNGSGTCDQCHFTQKNVWDDDNQQNYCGVCGAIMDGGMQNDQRRSKVCSALPHKTVRCADAD